MQLPEEPHGPDGLDPLQTADLYTEDDVPLDDVRTSVLRSFVYAGGVIALLFVIMGATVQISRQLSFDFVLKGNRQERVYRFFKPVYLEDRFVEVGDHVEAGQPLLQLRSPEIVEMLTAYEDAQARRAIFDDSERRVYQSQIEALRLEEAQLSTRIAEYEEQKRLSANVYQSELEKLTYLAEQAAQKFERAEGLVAKNLIASDDLEEARAEKIVAENALSTLREQHQKELSELDASLRVAALEQDITRAKRREKESAMANLRASLDLEIRQGREALERNYGRFELQGGRLLLLASQPGRVSFALDESRDAEAGTTLLKLLDAPTDLYAYATIPPRTIGLIEEGDAVVMKVATFPHYEWGTVRGRIRRLSLTPDEEGLYACEVQITNAGALAPHLQIGMTGELSVLVEERSFFGYVFRGFQRSYHEVISGS